MDARAGLALTGLALAAALAGGGVAAAAAGLPQGSEAVTLDPAQFTTRIDNPWWPMRPGSRWVFRETGDKRVEVTVTRRTRRVAGIEARVVHDVVTQRGKLVEDTYDWYAQDRAGNVWYLGEDTKEYRNGRVVSTKGSWEAGVDGAQAGVAMPARPRAGLRYRQEYYAGQAEDRGRVLRLGGRTTVPAGRYAGVLVTEDTTPLDPGVKEHKLYARGVGPVRVVDVAGGGGGEELLRYVPGR